MMMTATELRETIFDVLDTINVDDPDGDLTVDQIVDRIMEAIEANE